MLHAWPNENAFGAKPARRDTRHGGANAELARFVAGRAHDAPLRGRTADDDRPATQRRIIALFDRGIESVHVEMENDAEHWSSARLCAPRKPGAEATKESA